MLAFLFESLGVIISERQGSIFFYDHSLGIRTRLFLGDLVIFDSDELINKTYMNSDFEKVKILQTEI